MLMHDRRHLAGHFLSDPGVWMESATQRGYPGTSAGPARPCRLGDLAVAGSAVVVQPRVVELVMLGCRSEVPDHRLAASGQQREPDELVHRPRANVSGRHVADVGEVEGQQGAELGGVQVLFETLEPIVTQSMDIDSRLPIDCIRPIRADCHSPTPRSKWCSI